MRADPIFNQTLHLHSSFYLHGQYEDQMKNRPASPWIINKHGQNGISDIRRRAIRWLENKLIDSPDNVAAHRQVNQAALKTMVEK